MAKHWGPPEWISYLLRKKIPLLIIESPEKLPSNLQKELSSNLQKI